MKNGYRDPGIQILDLNLHPFEGKINEMKVPILFTFCVYLPKKRIEWRNN